MQNFFVLFFAFIGASLAQDFTAFHNHSRVIVSLISEEDARNYQQRKSNMDL